jgi:RNA polymerase sigma-70 factor (TIGR02960 family)
MEVTEERAYAEQVEQYRRELLVHCYRMLGSIQDAEDVLQETMLAAWRGLSGFENRSSLRTWLYRIATNRCLNFLRDAARRPLPEHDIAFPEPTRVGEPLWLEPYPDVLLDGVPDQAPGPDARYESREAISLAFVTAVQHLPPRQRAVLLLRDVLGYRAAEVAALLDMTEDAVTSALKRARAVMPVSAPSTMDPSVAQRFAAAFEAGDMNAIVALLAEDVRLTMPPLPFEYIGRAATADFLTRIAFRDSRRHRLIPVGANRQIAFGCYLFDAYAQSWRAYGVLVLDIAGNAVSGLTRFPDNAVLPYFGLPRRLPN